MKINILVVFYSYIVTLFTTLSVVKAGNRTKLFYLSNLFFPNSLMGSMSRVKTVREKPKKWKKRLRLRKMQFVLQDYKTRLDRGNI